MGKIQKPSENSQQSKRNPRTQRRNKLRSLKSQDDPWRFRRELQRQIHRLKRLTVEEKVLRKEILIAKLPSEASGIQTDIQAIIHKIKLTSAHIEQLPGKINSPGFSFVKTPIESLEPRKLPRIPKLSADEEFTISSALNTPEWSHENFTTKDLELLQDYYPKAGTPGDYWLNDNIVMEYLKLISQDSSTIFVMDSQISSAIASNSRRDDKKPSAYYRKKKLLDYNKILFPINSDAHWTLVVWDGVLKTLTYYDSLNTPQPQLLIPFKHFLNERLDMEKAPRNSLAGLQEILDPLPKALKQMNAVDCGVYLLMISRSIIQDFPFNFDQSQMNALRKVILYELITQELLAFN